MRRETDFMTPSPLWYVTGLPKRAWAYLAGYFLALLTVAFTWPSWWPN